MQTQKDAAGARRRILKLAIVAAGKRHFDVATEANAALPPEAHLSEHDVTRLICGRMNPSQDQAVALAAVWGFSVPDLFPELAQDTAAPAGTGGTTAGEEGGG